jgi:hypothetical protein
MARGNRLDLVVNFDLPLENFLGKKNIVYIYMSGCEEENEVEIIELGHRGSLEPLGDKKLAEKPQAPNVYDDATINRWRNQIKIEYPEADEALVNLVLNTYQKRPEIVSEICQEHRDGLHQVDPKERITGGTYTTQFETGNDLF